MDHSMDAIPYLRTGEFMRPQTAAVTRKDVADMDRKAAAFCEFIERIYSPSPSEVAEELIRSVAGEKA